MKITSTTVFLPITIVSPTALLAQTPPTIKVEGTRTKAAGPPMGIIMDITRFAGRIVLALLVVGALAQPTRADPQSDFKAKFKAGCKSSNGSWIESADGSYQCNTSSGETNMCFKDSPPKPCVHKKL
jgi:hypothetical protein